MEGGRREWGGGEAGTVNGGVENEAWQHGGVAWYDGVDH